MGAMNTKIGKKHDGEQQGGGEADDAHMFSPGPRKAH
jgi:hypothetical protein